MALVIGTGAEIRDAMTGALLGVTRDALEVRRTVDGLARGFLSARDAVKWFHGALEYPRRIECLRYQARRKGRPGWRSIRIPRRLP